MSNEKEICFKGTIIRKTFDGGDDYKIYAVDVSKEEYPEVKHTKYGTVSILGSIHELGIGSEYEVRATEELSKYGYSYRVTNIRRQRPTNSDEMYMFLKEILTINQAQALYEVYPDIVERVMTGRLDDIDLNKLHGIKEYTFNIIKTKIIENFCLAELVVEFNGMLSLAVLNKLYHKYTSVEMLKSKLKENPYKCVCGISGIGFIKADSILLEMESESKKNIQQGKEPIIEFEEDLRTSKHRCLSCLLYLLEENENNGHTVISITELRNQCIKLVPACSQYFVDCLKHQSIFYDKDLLIASLMRTHEAEQYVAHKLVQGLTIKRDPWKFDIEKYRKVNGYDLSDEQMLAVKMICENNIMILNGSAGTGKSSSIQAIINMLDDHRKSYVLFAPTGKAAKVLKEYTNKDASTVHRGLGYMPPNEWGYNEAHPLECDVVITDEFSMEDLMLFKHQIGAIDFDKTKLMIVGDNAQLPSVGAGNLLHDFMESGVIPTATLTQVFRYADGGLMKVATDVRKCRQYLSNITEKCTIFGSNKDYTFINTGDSAIPKSVVQLYKKLLKQGYKPEDIQVLTAYKKGDCGTSAMNNAIQKVSNKNYASRDYMKVGDTVYYLGDLVIQNVNNYHAELYDESDNNMYKDKLQETMIANGETGIIQEISMNYAIIDFDGTKVKYYRNDMQMIGLGYCITIHKSQGSGIKVVILTSPQAHIYMLNSNLIYVGLTRMKEKAFHFGSAKTVNIAVKKKANLIRNTDMQRLLKLEVKNMR